MVDFSFQTELIKDSLTTWEISGEFSEIEEDNSLCKIVWSVEIRFVDKVDEISDKIQINFLVEEQVVFLPKSF